MSNEWNLIELGDWGVLRLHGPDAVRFLQGQVSCDVERLTPERSQLTGYHNPQGRTIALLRLLSLAPDDVLTILPRELAAPVATRLAKFVLRAKVKIADESANWRITGLVAPHPQGSAPSSTAAQQAPEARAASWAAKQFEEASARAATADESTHAGSQLEQADSVVELPTASALMLPQEINGQSRSDATIIARVGAAPARWLVISPADQALPLAGCATGTREAWHLLDIAEGLPTVYAATSEEFVAQMLNLDAIGGIAFDKGCYTGQEVIARAHYRGRVKRRLQRFLTRGPASLSVGQSGQLADGRAFKVVESALLADGRCEFLAVAPVVGTEPAADEAPVAVKSGEQSAAHGVSAPVASLADDGASVVNGAAIDAEALPLPYQLPQ
jgi:folate-binding protein YgfZ